MRAVEDEDEDEAFIADVVVAAGRSCGCALSSSVVVSLNANHCRVVSISLGHVAHAISSAELMV